MSEQKHRLAVIILSSGLSGVVIATPAAADMILSLPIIAQWLGFLIFIPVVILEIIVASRVAGRLGQHVDVQDVSVAVLIANIISFMLGVLVVFLYEGALMYTQFLPREGFFNLLLWELEYPDERIGLISDLAVFLAALMVFVPTWLIESPIFRVFLRCPPTVARKVAFWANAGSYLVIFLVIETAQIFG